MICYIAIENGHRNSGFSHQELTLLLKMAIEIVDFPIKKNDLPIKHGVFSSLCSCLPGRVIEGFTVAAVGDPHQ